jgi:2,5-diketo-D-gluconate reductase A
MERAKKLGYARSIGVSNYDVGQLEEVMATATVPPVVDQVQFSPFEYRRKLLDAAEKRKVAIEAYSPLGTGRHLADPTVKKLASQVGRTPAQVLLRWCLQRGVIVITKSTHRNRIEENAGVFDFTLADEVMAQLDGLDETEGTDRALESTWW